MNAKTEKEKQPAAAPAAPQAADTPATEASLPPIHIYGQSPEPEHIALAKIRCECLKLASGPDAYDQRSKLKKAQEMYDWVIDPEARFEDAKPRVVQTKPVDYSQANAPDEPRGAQPAQSAAGAAVDYSGANV